MIKREIVQKDTKSEYFFRSSNVGARLCPTTRSISSCIFCCTLGSWQICCIKRVIVADKVITDGSTKSTHDNINWSSEKNAKIQLNFQYYGKFMIFRLLRLIMKVKKINELTWKIRDFSRVLFSFSYSFKVFINEMTFVVHVKCFLLLIDDFLHGRNWFNTKAICEIN